MKVEGTGEVLIDTVWLGERQPPWLRAVVLVLIGSLVTALSAKVKLDIGPVPLTLQSLAVLTIGAAYGWRLGAATMIVYLAEGAAGLPVFAGPSIGPGFAYLLGPTGGYLFGFVFAGALVGWLAEHGFDRSFLRMFCAMLLGAAVIHIPGVLWLSTLVGMEKAISVGLMPFIIGDVVKAALAAVVFPVAWRWIGGHEGGARP